MVGFGGWKNLWKVCRHKQRRVGNRLCVRAVPTGEHGAASLLKRIGSEKPQTRRGSREGRERRSHVGRDGQESQGKQELFFRGQSHEARPVI